MFIDFLNLLPEKDYVCWLEIFVEDAALLVEEENTLSDSSEYLELLLLREWQILVFTVHDIFRQRPVSIFHQYVSTNFFIPFVVLPLKDAPYLHNVRMLKIRFYYTKNDFLFFLSPFFRIYIFHRVDSTIFFACYCIYSSKSASANKIGQLYIIVVKLLLEFFQSWDCSLFYHFCLACV